MSQSSPHEPSPPGREELLANRSHQADQEALELDRRKAAVRREIAQLYQAGGDALRAVGLGLDEHDDHRLIEGLRKLLAVGLSCKPPADQLEQMLPQPSRLFDPQLP